MNKQIDKLKLAQFGNLEFLAKQVVEGFITGLHKSPFHGFSVEFAEHRLYNSGESTRHIDWKLYARSGRLFTKKYEEETNLRCQIVIDCSSSMFFPKDAELNKFEYSCYAAASLIEIFKRQRDAVGLTLFSETIELNTDAKSSLSHHHFLYSELEKRLIDYSPESKKGSNTVQLLHDIAELSHKRSLIIIFSDFFDDPDKMDEYFHALQHMKHNKHEVILFHVTDKALEIDFNLENRPYNLIDMETGDKIKIQPNEIKSTYQTSINKYYKELKTRATNYKIDFETADLAEGYYPVLLAYLLKRQRML